MQVFRDRFQAESGWNADLMRNIQQKTPDDGQRSCPKHVDFYDRINFGKLVRLVGY